MPMEISYPLIDPVLFEAGFVVVRWYALAYVAGLVLGWRHMLNLAKQPPQLVGVRDVDDFLLWATLGVVVGGRLGYVLLYKPGFYLENPSEILMVMHGGMSFHGGILGVTVAGVVFCGRRGIQILAFADLLSCAAPIGLFFGRVANFVNAELYGRATDVPWAMRFPLRRGGEVLGWTDPRHPSQFYEAGLEGALLFLVALWLWRKESIRRAPGTIAGVFIAGYGASRFLVEFFREPDAHLGAVVGFATMGQLLSIPMIPLGVGIAFYAVKRRENAAP